MRATLDIDPQDGDLDFLYDIERTFGIRLKQEHVGDWKALGDIHDTLKELLPSPTTGGACPTSMAFYRLRDGLMELGIPRSSITPAASLCGFANSPRTLMARLAKSSQLTLPDPQLRLLGMIGAWLFLTALIGAVVSAFTGHWILAATVAGVLPLVCGLIYLDPGDLPAGIENLGDLARRSAALSRPALVAAGARQMPGEAWDVLAAIAAEHSGLDARELGPDTYLFRHVYEADQQEVSV